MTYETCVHCQKKPPEDEHAALCYDCWAQAVKESTGVDPRKRKKVRIPRHPRYRRKGAVHGTSEG